MDIWRSGVVVEEVVGAAMEMAVGRCCEVVVVVVVVAVGAMRNEEEGA